MIITQKGQKMTNYKDEKSYGQAKQDMINKTYQYAKKHNVGMSQNHPAWNDSADAFRHAFMEASLTVNYSSFAANSSIIIAFEDEWLRYEDIIEKRKQKEEAKRKQKEIDDIQEKRRNEILFDFTDEAGLKESMQ